MSSAAVGDQPGVSALPSLFSQCTKPVVEKKEEIHFQSGFSEAKVEKGDPRVELPRATLSGVGLSAFPRPPPLRVGTEEMQGRGSRWLHSDREWKKILGCRSQVRAAAASYDQAGYPLVPGALDSLKLVG